MLAIYVIAMVATCLALCLRQSGSSRSSGASPPATAPASASPTSAERVGTGLCALGLAGIYAFVSPKYANAPADVMPAQPAGITLPAPSVPPPNSTNPSQPGEVR